MQVHREQVHFLKFNLSKFLFEIFVWNFCLKFCSKFLFEIWVGNFCSEFWFPILIPIFDSKFLFEISVRIFGSNFWFEFRVRNFWFDFFDRNCCSKFIYFFENLKFCWKHFRNYNFDNFWIEKIFLDEVLWLKWVIFKMCPLSRIRKINFW